MIVKEIRIFGKRIGKLELGWAITRDRLARIKVLDVVSFVGSLLISYFAVVLFPDRSIAFFIAVGAALGLLSGLLDRTLTRCADWIVVQFDRFRRRRG